jgi:hypothetical protein
MELRWRRDGEGGFVARAHHAGPTYHIKPEMMGAPIGKQWRLFIDGVELADASGCVLRFVKHRAGTHADEAQPASS